MHFLPPVVVHGTLGLEDAEIERSCQEYRRLVEALRDDRLPMDGLDAMSRLNSDVDALLGGGDA